MPGRQLTGPLTSVRPKQQKRNSKRTQKRTLDALAIAEQQHPFKTKLRQHRLGVSEQDNADRKRPSADQDSEEEGVTRPSKRQRAEGKDRYGNQIEGGSDSEGNEWMLGHVNSEDDSDLDSDAAMGESDEEKFEGFIFRGSSSTGTKSKMAQHHPEEEHEVRDIDLDEVERTPVDDEQYKDGLGDEAVDLADVLDADNDGETDGSDSDSVSESGNLGFSDVSDQEDSSDPKKIALLGDMIANMDSEHPGTSFGRKSANDALESTTPSTFGIKTDQKLTLADLQATVTDPTLRKSLKLLADDKSKSSSKRKGVPGKLQAPLPKRQQDQLDRAAAYEKSKEALNRWIDTVKHNRRAEHLHFPLKDPNSAVAQGGHRMLPTTQSKPVNELESVIQNILAESGLVTTAHKSNEDQNNDFADLRDNEVSLEEVQARRAELRRARDLLFREEKRAKRIKKIKSKSYRKVHRKERERNAQREKEALAAAGVDDSEEEQERNDRRRAEERMGQRHRESRWAKGVKQSGRAAWDEDARSGVAEMARREEELRKRIEGRNVENDEDESASSESESHEDDGDEVEGSVERQKSKILNQLQHLDNGEGAGEKSTLSSMRFMQKADAARRAQNDAEAEAIRRGMNNEEAESEDEPTENTGRRTYGPLKTKPSAAPPKPRSEFEEKPQSDEEDEIRFEDPKAGEPEILVTAADKTRIQNRQEKQSISRTHLRKAASPPRAPPDDYADNPWLSTKKHNRKARKEDPRAEAIIANTLPPSPPPKSRSALKGSRAAAAATLPPTSTPAGSKSVSLNENPDPAASSSEEASDAEPSLQPFVLRNRELVARAFAGDSVVADFAAEKQSTVQAEDDQIIDSTLPGWGSWVGEGISKKASRGKKRFLTTQPGVVKAADRKDAKLDRVIIHQGRVKKNAKYLASSLPHPFENRAQYERSLRLPVGPEWTTKETFQGMTMPRVLVKQGVIAPMERPIV